MLTQKIVHELLEYYPETGKLFWRKRNNNEAFTCLSSSGYPRGMILDKGYYAHRIIWFWVYGEWPKEEIDHINHIRTDNRLCNLREVSRKENHKNLSKRKNNTSGKTGVWFDKTNKKWCAMIHNEKWIFLGRYILYEDAVKARKNAEIKHNFHENHGKTNER